MKRIIRSRSPMLVYTMRGEIWRLRGIELRLRVRRRLQSKWDFAGSDGIGRWSSGYEYVRSPSMGIILYL